MKSKRRHLSAEFKARIAKEALKGEKTIAEIASSNDVSPAQVGQWKQEAETRMQEIFEKTDKKGFFGDFLEVFKVLRAGGIESIPILFDRGERDLICLYSSLRNILWGQTTIADTIDTRDEFFVFLGDGLLFF